jgi:hypothetical protein
MNYKNKYLKYKEKYLNLLNQKGGEYTVPPVMGSTQSWFMMPLLFMPFNDMHVDFPSEFIDASITLKNNINTFSITEISEILTNYYNNNDVDLYNRRSLEHINNVYFDDSPSFLHLTGIGQEVILDESGTRTSVEAIIQYLISMYPSKKYNYYAKDYLFDFINNNLIKIQYINKYNKLLYLHADQTKYKLYNKLDCLICEPSGENNNVLICFGFWGDNNFGMFKTISKYYNGLILYFIDTSNKWYSDKFHLYTQIINKYANMFDNYYFLGMSMGGYASIYMSLQFPNKNCVSISLNPQILSTGLKDNIIIQKENESVPKVNPLGKIQFNILDKLKENMQYTTKIYTLIGKTECSDKDEWLLMDQFHIGLIADYPNVNIIILNENTHHLGEKIKLSSIVQLISINNTFTYMFYNQKEGNKILFENIKYKN